MRPVPLTHLVPFRRDPAPCQGSLNTHPGQDRKRGLVAELDFSLQKWLLEARFISKIDKFVRAGARRPRFPGFPGGQAVARAHGERARTPEPLTGRAGTGTKGERCGRGGDRRTADKRRRDGVSLPGEPPGGTLVRRLAPEGGRGLQSPFHESDRAGDRRRAPGQGRERGGVPAVRGEREQHRPGARIRTPATGDDETGSQNRLGCE
jgi:hypothetical protein